MVTFVSGTQTHREVDHYYLENHVTLLECSSKASPQSKHEGWTQQLSGALHCLGQSLHQLSSREKGSIAPHVMSSSAINLSSVPTLSLYLLDRGNGSYYQIPFPDRSLLTVYCIQLAVNECLLSFKNSCFFKRYCSQLNRWQGLVYPNSDWEAGGHVYLFLTSL